MKSHLTIPIAVLVAALLCYLLLWERGTDASRQEGESTRAVSPRGERRSGSTAEHPTKLPRPTKSTRLTVAASHAPEQLKDFIIPHLELRDVTLERALNLLFENYAEICSKTGESPVHFTYKLTATPHQNVNLHLRQISFLSALGMISTQSGMDMSRSGAALTFSPIDKDPGDLTMRATFEIPPNLTDRLVNMFDPNEVLDDPFNPGPTASQLPELLRKLGVIQSDDTKILYTGKTSQLIVDGNPKDFVRLKSALNDLVQPQVAIKTNIKFVDTDEPLDIPTGSVSDTRFQLLMREMAQKKGTDIASLPTVTSRPGQESTIEIGRELILPDKDNPDLLRSEWLGVRVEINSGGYGFGVREKGHIFTQERIDNDPTRDLLNSSTDYVGLHFDGQTMIVETTTPQGKPRYAFITSEKIAPSDDPFSAPTVIPSRLFQAPQSGDPFSNQPAPSE